MVAPAKPRPPRAKPLRYHGGKSRLAPWLHGLAPAAVTEDPTSGYTHRLHPYAGGLGELWLWDAEGISETVNDLSGRLVNFYTVLADPLLFNEFRRRVAVMPLCEPCWEAAAEPADDPAEDAARFFLFNRQSRQGRMQGFATPTARVRRGMNENVSAWLASVEGLPQWHDRFKRVEVRRMDAAAFVRTYDHPRALFVCDPPYLTETRVSTDDYEHEMTPEQHELLLETLAGVSGRFLLCGYSSDLYRDYAAQHGWHVTEKTVAAASSGAKRKPKRVEVVWTNYAPAVRKGAAA